MVSRHRPDSWPEGQDYGPYADIFAVCKDYSQVVSYLEGKQFYSLQLECDTLTHLV